MGKSASHRIAFRVEGAFWVAYWARMTTMDGAIELGRLRMSLASVPDCKRRFMDLMQAGVAVAVKETTGRTVRSWDVEAAPEHERSGNA